jgi:tetratricopeptide (TPR) repeat protein
LSNIEDYIEQISQKIDEGRVVLFLGAGASAAANAPQQDELVTWIKQKFSKLDPGLKRLVDVCEDYLETRGYDIKDLEEFITEKLRDLKPSAAHLSLTKYNWPAIFTTNFDDLIEASFRSVEKPAKNCFVVSYPSEAPTIDPRKVYVFKLMGTICTRSENKMVLSRSDFTKMVSKRTEYLNHLEDFVKDGTIVFIGYSTTDRLVTDLIDEVKDKIGFQRLPWSYVLLKDLDLSEKDKYRFEMHKMIPVKCTFEGFFGRLDKVKHPEVPSFKAEPKGEAVIVEGKTILLSSRELEMYHDFFEVMNNGLMPSKAKSKDDFFKGMINDYGCYAEDFDFKRDVYFKPEQKDGKTRRLALKDRVFSEIQKRDANENKVLLVTGAPGVGKSVLLRRLAFDVFTSGQAPVILFDRTRAFFDLKLLSSILVAFDRKFDEASKERPTHRLKSLIIIDDSSVDPLQVRDTLSSRGRLALVVVACRENEMRDEHHRIPVADVYRLNELLSADEKSRITKHLFDLKILASPDEKWDTLIDKEFEDSFFATMYTLVQQTRKPLNEIIYDQYVKLDPLSKQAFSFVCAFHQFDLPINLELLVRALGCGYDEFYNEVLPKARGIIFEESMPGYLLYTTHHRIIAKKTIEFFFAFGKNQEDLFMGLFSRVNLKRNVEREIIEKLLINHLSSKSRSTDLSRLEKIEIFQEVCSQYEIKSLLHHLGILISDEGTDPQKASEVLRKALTVHEGGRSFQRSELDQNILTSLGVLHSKIAVKNMKQKFAHEFVEQEIRLAESYFVKARFGGWPNAHSYHAHAMMFLQLGDMADELRKSSFYSRAFDILQDARDNLNEDQLQLIRELEVQAYQKIGKLDLSLKKAAEVAQKYQSAAGYTLFASTLISRSNQFTTWLEREPLLKQAMSAIETSLDQFPLDERSLVLKAKLTRRLFPTDNSKYFATLQGWYNNAKSPNVFLLFELGISAFKEKQYEYSKRIFEKLENERISGGIKNRFAEQLYLGLDGKPLKFVGVITSIESSYDGFIRCDTLRDLNYPLHFRPIACAFQPAEGEMVDFNIAFDFLGARAVRVTRI